jgi:hypothetical protein
MSLGKTRKDIMQKEELRREGGFGKAERWRVLKSGNAERRRRRRISIESELKTYLYITVFKFSL